MQKNYIILAHKNPQQLKNLIDKLNDTTSNFYIHIDKNIDIKPFANSIKYSNVKFITNREDGTWCDIGIVNASINSIKQINSDNRDGYCILLSGQDFPIKSNIQIDFYLPKLI